MLAELSLLFPPQPGVATTARPRWPTPVTFVASPAILIRLSVPSVCPRCGSDLATLALPETETVTCETCGYAGVEADHTGEPTGAESWAEAVERFQTTE